MSFEDWKGSTASKVQGSWNLHQLLPEKMDFFIFLSSVCGVFGNGGQSNYAAGNTFEDALAQYRTMQGQKTISLDLGLILGEGFVAENKEIMDHLLRLSLLRPIAQEELFAMLEYYCDPSLQLTDPIQSQVITGLELPANQIAYGREVPAAMHQPLFAHMHEIDSDEAAAVASSKGNNNGNRQSQDLRSQFVAAPSSEEASAVVAEALQLKMSRILGINNEEMTPDSKVESYGVDSLVAVELRNWLVKELDADIAVFEILGSATLAGVGSLAASKSSLRQEQGQGQGKEQSSAVQRG